MKKLWIITVLCLTAQISFSQVVVLNYMKVPPGGEARYEAAEKYAQKVLQAKTDEGTMIGWELYRVHHQGSESEYNYVTVDIYENLSSSVSGMNWEYVQNVLGDDADKAMDEIMNSRKLTYRETLGFNMGVPAAGDENFILIHYIKASNPEKYYEMERAAYMPLHQLAVDNGKMSGWSVWTPWLHDGKLDYTALVVDGFSSLEQIDNRDFGSLYEEFKKDKSEEELEKLQKYYDKTGKTRTMVKSQLWEKVASTTPRKE